MKRHGEKTAMWLEGRTLNHIWPRIVSKHQTLEEARKAPLQSPQRECGPADTLSQADLGLLASRTGQPYAPRCGHRKLVRGGEGPGGELAAHANGNKPHSQSGHLLGSVLPETDRLSVKTSLVPEHNPLGL